VTRLLVVIWFKRKRPKKILAKPSAFGQVRNAFDSLQARQDLARGCLVMVGRSSSLPRAKSIHGIDLRAVNAAYRQHPGDDAGA
jgi:hypothetical protein